MPILHPFKAYRPEAEFVSQIASVPYDVVNREESLALATGNPLSFLHVIRSEIDLDPAVDAYHESVYKLAAKNFSQLAKAANYTEESEASIYLYRLIMNGRSQTGIMACSAVQDYERGVIKVHEKTRPQKVLDRVNHMHATSMHAEPVFLAFRDSTKINQLMNQDCKSDPLYDFEAPDKIRHTIWKVKNPIDYINAYAELDAIYVADGHHRIESARQLANSKLQQPNIRDHEFNFFLSVSFPSSQLAILPYHRVILESQVSVEDLIKKLNTNFSLTKIKTPDLDKKGKINLYTHKSWYTFNLEAAASASFIDSLDSRLLELQVLQPIFDIQDLRTDKRIDFVGGIRGTTELERLVDSGNAKFAFALHAVSIEDIFKVADQGQVMPPKSTWFEPKLRSGILVHTFYSN